MFLENVTIFLIFHLLQLRGAVTRDATHRQALQSAKQPIMGRLFWSMRGLAAPCSQGVAIQRAQIGVG